MDVVETKVAIAVDIPASTRTGRGSDEPEPDPSSGCVSAANIRAFMRYVSMMRDGRDSVINLSSYTDI